jgi:hypothetical protein
LRTQWLHRNGSQPGDPCGLAAQQLPKEFFTPTPDSPRVDDAFEVEIGSTGTRFTVPENRSVLDVLLANGIEISSISRSAYRVMIAR